MCIVAALLVAALLGTGAHATGTPQTGPTFTVNLETDTDDGGCYTTTCTFRDALAAAETSANAGNAAKVVFADGVTYIDLTQQPQLIPNAGSITIDGGGTVTLDSRSAVPAVNAYSVLSISRGTLTVENMEFCCGTVAAIDVLGGTVEFDNDELESNDLSFAGNTGGAVFIDGGTLTINDGSIHGNRVTGTGGGIAVDGGTLTANGVDIYGNESTGDGGDVYVGGGSFSMVGGSLTDGENSANGGGIAVEGSGTAFLNRVPITASYGEGAGMYVSSSGDVTVANSTISGNTANSDGGGGGIKVDNSAASVTLYGDTITGNTGYGLLQTAGGLNFTNTLLAGNSSGECKFATLYAGSQGNNLSTDGNCRLTNTGDQPSVADPKIGTLSDGAVPLLAGSPALDAGADLGATYATDVLGTSRPQGGGWDIGSYEALEHQLVTNITGSGTITPSSAGTTGGWYLDGTEVTLTEQPTTGWDFTGWTGDCTGTNTQATLTMSADHTCTATFVLVQTPVISSFTPSSGKATTAVTITGTHFTAASAVTFDGTAQPTFTVASDTEIDTTVPNGAATGPIAVTNSAGTGTSSSDFIVVTVAPTVSSFAPETGKAGTAVTITGTDMLGASGVTFGGVAAQSFTVKSATEIDAVVASGGASGAVAVQNAVGTGTSAGFVFVVAPSISSFTPAHGAVGASVHILGSGLTGVTAVKFNATTATTITDVGDDEVDATVPAGATTGTVSVTNIAGTAVSTDSFEVATGTPTVTSFTPTEGGKGMTVTIKGTHLAAATSVSFHGSSASFTLGSETSLTATVPPSATTGPISVTNDVGTGTSTKDFTAVVIPSISNFTPTSGKAGTTVTISGTGLASAKSVTLAGKTMKVTSDSATEIKAVVPAGAANGAISVTTPGGSTTASGTFDVTAAPVISSFTPASGQVGDTVTITGSHLAATTGVTIAGVAADNTPTDDTHLSVTVPAGALTGKIAVTNPAGTATTTTAFVVVSAAPTVTSFTPSTGKPSTVVTVTGTGFLGASSATVGGATATFKVVSATKLTATVPQGASSGHIAVGNAVGTGTSTGTFVVVNAPVVTSFDPSSGKASDAVAIHGSGFTGVTAVKFNGKTATVDVINDGEIDTSVPTGATSGNVSVTNLAGTSSKSFTVIVAKPVVSSFTPTAAAVGATVTITGQHLAAASGVTFGGVSAVTVTPISDAKLTAVVPSGAASGSIDVTNELGSGASVKTFTVVPAPTISSLAPGSGKVGTSVAINGTNLTLSSAATIGGKAMKITAKAATQVTAVVPAGATTGTIAVTTPGGTATSSDSFIVDVPPKVTSFAPSAAAVGHGIAIHGTGFTGSTSVAFGGASTTSLTIVSDTEIDVNVPSGAATGKVTVTNPAGTGTSSTSFVVLTVAPTVTSFTPSTGKAGTVVTVVGTNLTGASGVTFGGTNAASFTAVSDTKLTAVVASGGSSGVVAVANGVGTGSSSGDFTFVAKPSIASFDPASNKAGGSVTIDGSGFTGATKVAFHGKTATFTVATDGEIHTSVPTGATSGTVTVTNIAGTATSSTSYVVVTDAPVITSFSPASTEVGQTVTITGKHFLGASAVSFDTTAATDFSIVSDTKLTATVPDGAGDGSITVTNAIGIGTSPTSFGVLPLISHGGPSTSLSLPLWSSPVAFGGSALFAGAADTSNTITVNDPVGDAGSGPDISVFTATVNGDALTLSATFANRTSLLLNESVQFFIQTVAGGELDAAFFDDGEMYLAVWTGTTYQNIHDLTGSWSGDTFTTNLSLSDIQSAIHQPAQPTLYLAVGTFTNSSVQPTLADEVPDGNVSVPISTAPPTPVTTTTAPTPPPTPTPTPPPPTAKPQLAMKVVRLARARVEWKKLAVVHVAAGATVRITCTKGCKLAEQVHVARGVAASKRFVGVPFARGASFVVRVADKNGLGYWFRLTAVAKAPPGPAVVTARGCIAASGSLIALSAC